MKQFEDIKKRMPYAESEDYLKQLIEQSTETAIRKAARPKAQVRTLRAVIAAAAVAVLLLAIGLTQFKNDDQQMAMVQQNEQELVAADNGPIDDFLDTLSDDEAQLLAYYELDEVPEY